MKLATFDIFDTTLLRRCGVPDAVFHLVAEQLWRDNSMRHTEYWNLRRQAESKCRKNAGIEEIYAQNGFSCFPEYSAEQIMNAELAVEKEMLTVNPAIKEKIDNLREKGWTIKFLSDMYLPSEFLADVLRREGCLKDDEEVIVSCECDARKDDGILYRKVRETYHPERWIHFGDNKHSDYRMARKNGVKAHLVDFGFTPIERRIISDSNKVLNGWILNLLMGTARILRIRNGNTPSVILAVDYVAATYVPYVIWLMRKSKHNGLHRLHFLSRDGYIMMKIAETLDVKDIDLNYLFVSRKSLMPCYLREDSINRFIEMNANQSLIPQSIDMLLSKLQIERAELEHYGVKFNYKKILTPAQQKDFIDKIFVNKDFSPILMQRFRREGDIAEAYLRQEGLAEDLSQGMVDIGWLGTSRLMINKILNKNIPTFYVGVVGTVYDKSCGDYDSYFSSGQLDIALTGLIENYFSASPWPSTLGYKQGETNNILPRFAEGEIFTETDATQTNVKLCCDFTKELKPYIHYLNEEILFQWAKESLDSIATLRDEINLQPLLTCSFIDGKPMARKFNLLELLNFMFLGARYTAYDRASLQLTVGYHLTKFAWRQHERSKIMRTKLYKIYFNLKNRRERMICQTSG